MSAYLNKIIKNEKLHDQRWKKIKLLGQLGKDGRDAQTYETTDGRALKQYYKKTPIKDIYKESPSWYEETGGKPFSSGALASGLGAFETRANTVMSSRPGSSAGGAGGSSGFGGGGFSGGGFGGGGGGSW